MNVCLHICMYYVCVYVCMPFGAIFGAPIAIRRADRRAGWFIDVSQVEYACIMNVCIYPRAESTGSTIIICIYACMYYV